MNRCYNCLAPVDFDCPFKSTCQYYDRANHDSEMERRLRHEAEILQRRANGYLERADKIAPKQAGQVHPIFAEAIRPFIAEAAK